MYVVCVYVTRMIEAVVDRFSSRNYLLGIMRYIKPLNFIPFTW